MGKNDGGPSKKTQEKQQKKVIDDKTFGLKNKNKSAQVQKYVQQVQTAVKNNGMSQQKIMEMEFEKKKAQKQKEEEAKLLASLFNTVTNIKGMEKEEKDQDPKSQVCAFFKQGLCQKGKKCKYSHDLSLETQKEEIDIYTDQRTQLYGGQGGQNLPDIDEDESSATWDQEKIEQVAKSQEQKYKNQKPTEIVCKFFLQAIERSKYGWKWVCPNGMACHYRHCLPPGYILKKDIIEDKDEDSDLEEKLDKQIAGLDHSKATKITLELFLQWKEKRKERKQKEREEKRMEDVKKVTAKGKNHLMSGKALFQIDPNLFQDDEEAADEYEREGSDRSDSEDENGVEKIKAPKEEYRELVFKEKEAGNNKPKGIQNEDNDEEIILAPMEDTIEESQQEKQSEEQQQQKQENQIGEETNTEKKKKKKKKKKNSETLKEGEVQIDDDLFLEDN